MAIDRCQKMRRGMGKALAIFSLALTCSLLPQEGWTRGNLEKAVILLEQQSRTGKGEFINFLTGAASAYRWVGTNLDVAGAERAYCPAPDLMLDGRSYAKIALEEYKRAQSEYSKLAEYPLNVLTLALLRGLRAKFPCKSYDATSAPPTSLTGTVRE
jgi:hypothetical protein